MNNQDITKRLSEPFAESAIRQRRGAVGRVFNFIEGALVVERLNEVLGGQWSMEILETHMSIVGAVRRPQDTPKPEVAVRVRLTAIGSSREAWGGSTRDTGECVGDALKAATTDALKKAASLFGVGLHLYSDLVGSDQGADPPTQQPQEASPRVRADRAADRPPATTEQMNQIELLRIQLQWTTGTLAEKVRDAFNRSVDDLDSATAEQVVRRMKAALRTAEGGAR